jgi:Calcium binding
MHMTRPDKDEEREQRIHMEIIVDAYGSEEQAMGWYNYLDDILQFPFSARCVTRRATSPLKPGDKVKVVGMAPAEECEHDMFVMIQWKGDQLAAPLMQLEGVQVDEETQQAIEDWRYWVDRGYEL